jgi:hypothetical protein
MKISMTSSGIEIATFGLVAERLIRYGEDKMSKTRRGETRNKSARKERKA